MVNLRIGLLLGVFFLWILGSLVQAQNKNPVLEAFEKKTQQVMALYNAKLYQDILKNKADTLKNLQHAAAISLAASNNAMGSQIKTLPSLPAQTPHQLAQPNTSSVAPAAQTAPAPEQTKATSPAPSSSNTAPPNIFVAPSSNDSNTKTQPSNIYR